MYRHRIALRVGHIIQPRHGEHPPGPFVPRCLGGGERVAHRLIFHHPAQKLARVAHHRPGHGIVAAELAGVGIDLHGHGRQVGTPGHGVALVQARTQNQQHVGLEVGRLRRVGTGVVLRRQSQSGMTRAAIAKYAQRHRVVFRKNPLGAQRAGHRNAESIGQPQQALRCAGSNATVAGEDGDARARREQPAHIGSTLAVQHPRRCRKAILQRTVDLAHGLAVNILRQAQKNRPGRVAHHGAQRDMEMMRQQADRRHFLGEHRHRPHQGDIVHARTAAVLE